MGEYVHPSRGACKGKGEAFIDGVDAPTTSYAVWSGVITNWDELTTTVVEAPIMHIMS